MPLGEYTKKEETPSEEKIGTIQYNNASFRWKEGINISYTDCQHTFNIAKYMFLAGTRDSASTHTVLLVSWVLTYS